MNHSLLMAAAAGIVSAVCVVSVALGGPLAVVLYILVPLPLMLAGLALGWRSALVAGGVASLLLLLLAGPALAGLFAVSIGAPAALLSYMALLGRPDETGAMEWYPVGRIVIAAATMGALLSLSGMLTLGGSHEAIKAAVTPQMESSLKAQLEAMGQAAPKPEEVSELASLLVSLLPAAAAVTATTLLLVNLWLAGRITLASGELVRPWPDLARLRYPAGTALVFAAVLAAVMFLDGVAGLAAAALAGALFLAYVLAGLAIAHHATRGYPWRSFALTILYIAALTVSPALLLIAMTGLTDAIRPLRKGGGRMDEG